MTTDIERKYRQKAMRGKYHRLFHHLCGLSNREWKTTFSEVEATLGFKLPVSARRHRPWWANQTGDDHRHALAWNAAGWETTEVDMAAETLVFRLKREGSVRRPILDTLWPVHSAGSWPESLSLSREGIYEDRT